MYIAQLASKFHDFRILVLGWSMKPLRGWCERSIGSINEDLKKKQLCYKMLENTLYQPATSSSSCLVY